MIKKLLRKFAISLGLCLLAAVIRLVEWTPLSLLYRISDLWARFLVNSEKAGSRNTVRRNLMRVYRDMSPEEIKDLTRRYYSCFIDYLIEFVKQNGFTDEEMKERCRFTNTDLLKELFEQHKFVICYGGHMLNFEWLVSFPLVMKGYGMMHLYQGGGKNRLLNWVLSTRGRYGAINVPTTSPLKELVAMKKQLEDGTSPYKGVVFGTLADMDTNEAEPYKSTIFNYELELMTGSERIGRKFDMAFVYAHISRIKRGCYEVRFIEMNPSDKDTNPNAYTDEFVRLLEQNINEQPELWMQWGECRF